MSSRRGFQINQRAIDKHVKEITKGYEKAARRHGPTVPVRATTEQVEPVSDPRFTSGPETPVRDSRSARVRRAFFRWLGCR